MFDFDELDAIDEVLPSEPAPPETPVEKEEAEDTATAPGSDDASTDGCNSGKDGSEDKEEDEHVDDKPTLALAPTGGRASSVEPTDVSAQHDGTQSAIGTLLDWLCVFGFL